MKRSGGILDILAVMSVASMLFLSCIKDERPGEGLKAGDMIPDFSVTMNDGTSVSSSDLSGNVSCIMFFHTSCPDCRKALPIMQRFYDDYVSEGVRFAVISRSEGEGDINAFWASNGLDMPFSAQNTSDIYFLFAKVGIPKIYISGKDGIIRHVFADDPVPSYDNLVSAAVGLL